MDVNFSRPKQKPEKKGKNERKEVVAEESRLQKAPSTSKAFASSSLLRRTPPPSSTTATDSEIDDVPNTETYIPSVSTPGRNIDAEMMPQRSPIEGYIDKTRRDEEKELEKCKSILQVMKKAMEKQKNISADVKNGIHIIEESLEVISALRGSWKQAEKCHISQYTQTTPSLPRVFSSSKRRMDTSPTTEWADVVTRNEKRRRKLAKTREERMSDDEETTEIEEKVSREKPVKAKEGKERDKVPAPNKREKNKGKMKLGRMRPDALLIKPAEGKTYAGILKELRQSVKPEDTETEIRTIRQTRAGEVLVEFGKNTKNKEGFKNQVAEVLGNAATRRCEIWNPSPLSNSETWTAARQPLK